MTWYSRIALVRHLTGPGLGQQLWLESRVDKCRVELTMIGLYVISGWGPTTTPPFKVTSDPAQRCLPACAYPILLCATLRSGCQMARNLSVVREGRRSCDSEVTRLLK